MPANAPDPHDPSGERSGRPDPVPGGPRRGGGRPPGSGRLVVVRHGATAWSTALRHTGRTDLRLEPEGRDQARVVGRRLADHRFALVLVSPLARARETCELAGFAGAEVCDDLREWDYGAYEGRTTADIRSERPGWSLWFDGVPGGETLAEVATRADRVVAVARAAGGDVLVFAHAHILRVVAARWLSLPAGDGSRWVVGPASVSVLGWERETPVIERWNDTGGEPVT
ncbi:MAG TPA: histidine phosphatase family protein [Acidimicrobiales bacterium]|nr:histidine phosphatase family protein [Acidimicrobiales bacterium]